MELDDTWGKVISTSGSLASTVGASNPIRYRGYYYDSETSLYYLQSRYYDPVTGRFISPDQIIDLGNLYAYCGNDPVNFTDSTGYAWWHWAIGVGVVLGCAALTIATAGGFAAGMMAIGLAASGTVLAGASIATTIMAFATVGAGLIVAATAITATIDGAATWAQTGSFDAGVGTFMDYGEMAMWGAVGGAVIGGIGGYASYKDANTFRGIKTPGKNTPYSVYYNTKGHTITHYGRNGNMAWSRHNAVHGNSANPHWHLEMPHSRHLNSKGALIWEIAKKLFKR